MCHIILHHLLIILFFPLHGSSGAGRNKQFKLRCFLIKYLFQPDIIRTCTRTNRNTFQFLIAVLLHHLMEQITFIIRRKPLPDLVFQFLRIHPAALIFKFQLAVHQCLDVCRTDVFQMHQPLAIDLFFPHMQRLIVGFDIRICLLIPRCVLEEFLLIYLIILIRCTDIWIAHCQLLAACRLIQAFTIDMRRCNLTIIDCIIFAANHREHTFPLCLHTLYEMRLLPVIYFHTKLYISRFRIH